MYAAVSKLLAVLVMVAITAAPAWCNCAREPAEPIAAVHDCCQRPTSCPESENPSEPPHDPNCRHCNSTIVATKAAPADAATVGGAFDFVAELPAPLSAAAEVAATITSKRCSGPAPPLLHDLFHIGCLLTT